MRATPVPAPGRDALRRRQALAGAAGAAATLLAGCARPLGVVGPPAVVVRSQYLYEVKERLEAVWRSSGVRARLVIDQLAPLPRPGTPWLVAYGHTGDILDISPGEVHNNADPNFPDLRPLLSAANFSPAALLPGAVADYQDGSALRGLPLVVGEWQFYANTPLLGKLGIATPARWTWQAIVDALARAVGKGSAPSSVLVAGTGWGDVHLWGALVRGLGGSLTAGGTLDLSGAAAATAQIVSVARGYGWHPDPESNPSNGQWSDFYGGGFSRSAADALFAFLQPMRIYPGTVPPALRGLATEAFPRMPAGDIVPAYSGSGLALSPYAADPGLATRVLLWLYEPQQQRLLATNGWPPVVIAVARQVWPALQAAMPPFWAKFDGSGYTAIEEEITGGRPTNPVLLSMAVENACQAMYGGAGVAGELAGLQKRLEALIGAG